MTPQQINQLAEQILDKHCAFEVLGHFGESDTENIIAAMVEMYQLGQKQGASPSGNSVEMYTSTKDILQDILVKGASLQPFEISEEEMAEVERKMTEFDIEARRRAAQAFIDLSKIIITI